MSRRKEHRLPRKDLVVPFSFRVGESRKSCRRLTQVVKGNEGNINLIWQGAGPSLTKTILFPDDDERKIPSHEFSNTVDYCRFFILASSFVDECEAAPQEEPTLFMDVDDVVSNLMNVRGYDSESVAEMVEAGKLERGAYDEQLYGI